MRSRPDCWLKRKNKSVLARAMCVQNLHKKWFCVNSQPSVLLLVHHIIIHICGVLQRVAEGYTKQWSAMRHTQKTTFRFLGVSCSCNRYTQYPSLISSLKNYPRHTHTHHPLGTRSTNEYVTRWSQLCQSNSWKKCILSWRNWNHPHIGPGCTLNAERLQARINAAIFNRYEIVSKSPRYMEPYWITIHLRCAFPSKAKQKIYASKNSPRAPVADCWVVCTLHSGYCVLLFHFSWVMFHWRELVRWLIRPTDHHLSCVHIYPSPDKFYCYRFGRWMQFVVNVVV